MTEITNNNEDKRTIRGWLFNPFRFIAGGPALLGGLVVIVIATFIGSMSNTHFDGVLDVHIATAGPVWVFIAEGLIDWLSLAVVLMVFALIFSPRSFRIIDIFGTQALARWPSLVTALIMLPEANRRVTEYFLLMAQQGGREAAINPADAVLFAVAMIVSLLMIVWMVSLMYKAYAVSCNLKGGKAIGTFIAGLIIAEVISKIAIWPITLRFLEDL